MPRWMFHHLGCSDYLYRCFDTSPPFSFLDFAHTSSSIVQWNHSVHEEVNRVQGQLLRMVRRVTKRRQKHVERWLEFHLQCVLCCPPTHSTCCSPSPCSLVGLRLLSLACLYASVCAGCAGSRVAYYLRRSLHTC
eukprot:GHVU01219642.1.p2 GENE.GHVU01219642.1~~GHVU01219642.1.p2  ORF type:complete len:135 (+),score=2.53 GHVU01219642.1:338-742(+)